MTRRPAARSLRSSKSILAALLLASVGPSCDPMPTPVLGVTAGNTFLNAARLALADEAEVAPLPALDTVMIAEGRALSESALGDAELLVATAGMVAVVGHSNSTASLAASQVYNEARVVQIAPTSSAESYSEAGPFSFRLVPPDDRQGRFLAESITGELARDSARIALFYVNDDYGRGLRRAFLTALDTTRYRLVLDLPHAEESVDVTEIDHGVEALAASRADLVVWLGRAAVLARFLPGFRGVAGDIGVLGSDAVSQAVVTEDAGGVWNGVRFTDFVDPRSTTELRDFAARFEARFGQAVTGGEVLTYEATRLLVSALRDGARTGPEIQAWLRSLGTTRPPYAGLGGPITFDSLGNVERGYVLGTIGSEPSR